MADETAQLDYTQLLAAGLPATAPSDDPRLASVEALQAWLDNLPMANQRLATKMLGKALSAANGAKIAPKQRLRLQLLLAPKAHAVLGRLDEELGRQAVPVDDRHRELAEMATRFQCELAKGFLRALVDMAGKDGSISMFVRRHAILAVLHAQRHLDAALLKHYQLYRRAPGGLWRQIHCVYAFAERAGIADRRSREASEPGFGATNAKTRYLRTALFALACPYRLPGGSIQLTHHLSGLLAEDVAVALAGDAGDHNFVAPDDLCGAPRYAGGAERNHDQAPLRYDLSGLGPRINAALAVAGDTVRVRSHSDAEPITVDRGLLESLALSWGIVVNRSHARMPGEHSLRCVVGMEAVHYMAAGEQALEGFLSGLQARRATAAAWAASDAHGYQPSVHDARVVNQSLGGYRLQFADDDRLRLKVGEAVALGQSLDEDEPPIWLVGVLRWLRDGEAGVQAGVSLLSRAVEAVAFLDDETPRPALLIRESGGDHHDCLLVPTLSGDDIDVEQLTVWSPDGGKVILSAGPTVEKTGAFAQIAIDK